MTYRFAVDVGASRTMLAMIAPDSTEILAYERPDTQVLFTGRRDPGAALADAVLNFAQQHRVEIDELSGVGVGIPGIVDRAEGRVLTCPNLHVLDGALLGPNAESELKIPVYVDNNTNLIALGEYTAGKSKGARDMAVIFVGSGVGCGLILNGQLYEGADGAAAEFGHINVVFGGRLCTCGAHGCLEMYCSGKALALDAEGIFTPGELYNLGTRFAGAQLLIEQARAGHTKALDQLREAFAYLGVGVTSLVNMLNPRCVVLGGGIMLAWPEGLEIVQEIVSHEALPGVKRHLTVEMSQLQHHAGVLGGAALVAAQGDVTHVIAE